MHPTSSSFAWRTGAALSGESDMDMKLASFLRGEHPTLQSTPTCSSRPLTFGLDPCPLVETGAAKYFPSPSRAGEVSRQVGRLEGAVVLVGLLVPRRTSGYFVLVGHRTTFACRVSCIRVSPPLEVLIGSWHATCNTDGQGWVARSAIKTARATNSQTNRRC